MVAFTKKNGAKNVGSSCTLLIRVESRFDVLVTNLSCSGTSVFWSIRIFALVELFKAKQQLCRPLVRILQGRLVG